MVSGTETKDRLGIEGKGQQMSFRMTHYSFGPWRDSTVRVSLACGSIVRFERRLALSLGKTLVRNRLVSAVSTKLITFRRFKTERSYETFLPLVFLSCPCQLHVCRARANVRNPIISSTFAIGRI